MRQPCCNDGTNPPRDCWDFCCDRNPQAGKEVGRITVYHSAVVLRDNPEDADATAYVSGNHQARGWPDIAYHLLIDRHGNV